MKANLFHTISKITIALLDSENVVKEKFWILDLRHLFAHLSKDSSSIGF